jgi:hypothetical protein
MVLYPPDEQQPSAATARAPVDGLPPLDAPPFPSPPRRGARTAWLVGGAAGLIVTAAVLGGLAWDLDGQVSDLTKENATLTDENASLEGEVSELTGERDSLRERFPITQASMAEANLEGTYEFLFVPVEGQCTYSDCDQVGSTRYALSISRAPDGYALGILDLPGPAAPMSREGTVYSTSGVLPESLWGTCGDTPAETSFEMHLTVSAVGLAGTDLRAIEASGTYRQYTPANLDCGPSESTSTFTARRTG